MENMATPQSRLTIITSLLLAAMIVAAIAVDINSPARSSTIPEELRDLLVKQPVEIPSFKLMDQQKQPFTAQQFKGAWTFLFFGYTHCPDVCPVTLTALDDASSQLGKLKTGNLKIQYVFVSVDPNRDSPEILRDYVRYFNANFIAVTGDDKQLERLASPLGIAFERGPGTGTEYFVNHSSAMLLIDPQARYYARFRPPHYAEEIVDGFKHILTYSENQ